MKLALSRYRAQHGELPPEEEQESWRKEIMNALGMGDAAPLGTNAMSERITYLKKQLTEAKIRANIRKIIKEAE